MINASGTRDCTCILKIILIVMHCIFVIHFKLACNVRIYSQDEK